MFRISMCRFVLSALMNTINKYVKLFAAEAITFHNPTFLFRFYSLLMSMSMSMSSQTRVHCI